MVLSSPLLFLPTPIGVFFGKIERMETGKLLRELRHYLKISVKDFSAKLGVVPTTIYWYENGGTLTESHIEDICQAFNVDKEYFKGTMTLEDAVDYSGYNHQRVERIRDMMNERGIKTNKELLIIPLRRRRQSGKLGSSVPRAEQHLKAACLSISASLHLRQGLAVIDGASSLDEIARMSHASKAAAFWPEWCCSSSGLLLQNAP